MPISVLSFIQDSTISLNYGRNPSTPSCSIRFPQFFSVTLPAYIIRVLAPTSLI